MKEIRAIQTESSYDKNIYDYLFAFNLGRKINNKKYKRLDLSGVDFNLINKILSETLKVNKEIEQLNFIEN